MRSVCYVTVLQTFCEGPNDGGPTPASKISRGSGSSNPRRIDAYAFKSEKSWNFSFRRSLQLLRGSFMHEVDEMQDVFENM